MTGVHGPTLTEEMISAGINGYLNHFQFPCLFSEEQKAAVVADVYAAMRAKEPQLSEQVERVNAGKPDWRSEL